MSTAPDAQNSDRSRNLPASVGATTPRVVLSSSSKPAGATPCADAASRRDAIGDYEGECRAWQKRLGKLLARGSAIRATECSEMCGWSDVHKVESWWSEPEVVPKQAPVEVCK